MSWVILVVLLVEPMRALPLLFSIIKRQFHNCLSRFLAVCMRRTNLFVFHRNVPVLDVWHQLLVLGSQVALVLQESIISKWMV